MGRISLLVPDMPGRDELLPYLERIDKARWYTNFGPLVKELEAVLAVLHADADGVAPQVCSVSNATVGLELALRALGLAEGSRVLVPGLTFPASVEAVIRAGLSPVLCDVDPSSWLMTPRIAQQALRQGVLSAVMPVATYGMSQDVVAWDGFSRETGIPVVIDAAGAYGNQAVGEKGTAVFSLHATKALGAGEGGAVISRDTGVVGRVRRDSNFGIDLTTGYVESLGTNAKLSEYHAAVALAALGRHEARREARIALHGRYVAALNSQCPSLQLQQRPQEGIYSILAVLLPPGFRASDALSHFADRGIETRRWYWPTVREHPLFRDLETSDDLGFVKTLGERLIGMPFHPFLSNFEMETVVSELARYLRR